MSLEKSAGSLALETKWFSIILSVPKKRSDWLIFLSGIVLFAGTAVGIFDLSLKAATVFTILFFLLSLFRAEVEQKQLACVIVWLILIGGSALTFLISQIMLASADNMFQLSVLIPNVVICLMLTMLVFIATARWKISLGVSQILLLGFTIIEAFVEQSRGNGLMFGDIFSIRTALNVASNYHFRFSRTICYGLIICVLEIAAISRLNLKLKQAAGKNRLRAAIMCSICVLMIGISAINFEVERFCIPANGFFMSFIMTAADPVMEEPSGYYPEEAEKLAQNYIAVEKVEKSPNIIVIMNESFTDLNVFGEMHTNTEVLPFYNSLTEHAVKGYALADVLGGGTANSEYTTLTGNSTHFLAQGIIAYQSYLKNPAYSIVSELSEDGYDCVAMHPYNAGGWSRTTVYPLLGFDEMLFIDDFPQKNLVREYVSDQEMYEKIIEIYEQEENDKDFIFGVTMQNHGGYEYVGDNYSQTVELEGYRGEYPKAEQYLSILRESDKALEYLIDYFSQADEDVVILFFGDHQPRIEPEFLEELIGKQESEWTAEERQLQYTVPFFVWANYDIEEQYVELTSLNYLSNYLYEAAGIPLPPYNQFLRDMQQQIPAMNRFGYYSAEDPDTCRTYEQAQGDDAKWLTEYEYLVYNSLFDTENRNRKFFPTEWN